MKVKALVLLAVFLLVGSVAGVQAQQHRPDLRQGDRRAGAVLPGVTSRSPARCCFAADGDHRRDGSYQFPSLAVGTYDVKFELAGFKTDHAKACASRSAGTRRSTRRSRSPRSRRRSPSRARRRIVDRSDTGTHEPLQPEMLQSIPSARDPWVILEQTAGVAMDRQNVGGSASGQQSNFVSRGAAMREQKWNLDGIDITDMSATGGSPVYYDFDAFEEMQISTGGADVTMQSPGVGVNLVTKSGTDRLKGSGRTTSPTIRCSRTTSPTTCASRASTTGNPIQHIKDYGVRGRRPPQEGPRVALGQLRQAGHQRRHQRLLQEHADVPGDEGGPAAYSLEDTLDVPQLRHDHPQQLQREVRDADHADEPLRLLLQRRREGPQRA